MGLLPSGFVLGTCPLFSESRFLLKEDVLGVLQVWEGQEGAEGRGWGAQSAGATPGVGCKPLSPRDARKVLS